MARIVTIRKTGVKTEEVVYLMTPLTLQEASPQRLTAVGTGTLEHRELLS